MSDGATAFSEYRVDLAETTLCVRDGGNGPLMIFLHGITANRRVWDPVTADLSTRFRTVAVDQRGHGLSDAPRESYTTAGFVRDVELLVDRLGADRAFVVGHSLGARNALGVAALAPECVLGVVAIEFTPFIEATVFDALEERVLAGDRPFASADEVTAYLRRRYPRLPADAVDRRAEHGFQKVGGAYQPRAHSDAVAQTVRGLREELASTVAAVKAPTLVIRGAESTLVSADALDATRRLRPDFDYLVVDGTDHYVPEEAPQAVAEAIHRFADAVFQGADLDQERKRKEDRVDESDELRPATR